MRADARYRCAGYWAEEAAAPYCVFTDAGYDVDLASPEGGVPPVDAGSKVKPAEVVPISASCANAAALDVSRELRKIAWIANICHLKLHFLRQWRYSGEGGGGKEGRVYLH